MTKNRIPKPPKESMATSPAQRSSLWKRFGRRGSSSLVQTSGTPGAAIPLKSIKRDDSKGGASGLFRKLKGSFRNTPTNPSPDPAATDHRRFATSSRPSSPAFSIDSYTSAEVGRKENF